MYINAKNIILILVLLVAVLLKKTNAGDFSDESFMIAKITPYDYNSERLWAFIQQNNWSGIEFDIDSLNKDDVIRNSRYSFSSVLEKISLRTRFLSNRTLRCHRPIR